MAKSVFAEIPDSLPQDILSVKYSLLAELVLLDPSKHDSSDEVRGLDSLDDRRAQAKEAYLHLSKITNPDSQQRSLMEKVADIYCGGSGFTESLFDSLDMTPNADNMLSLLALLKEKNDQISSLQNHIAKLEQQKGQKLAAEPQALTTVSPKPSRVVSSEYDISLL